MLEFLLAILPEAIKLAEQAADPVYDEEKERQALLAIARKIEDKRAADKFGMPGPV